TSFCPDILEQKGNLFFVQSEGVTVGKSVKESTGRYVKSSEVPFYYRHRDYVTIYQWHNKKGFIEKSWNEVDQGYIKRPLRILDIDNDGNLELIEDVDGSGLVNIYKMKKYNLELDFNFDADVYAKACVGDLLGTGEDQITCVYNNGTIESYDILNDKQAKKNDDVYVKLLKTNVISKEADIIDLQDVKYVKPYLDNSVTKFFIITHFTGDQVPKLGIYKYESGFLSLIKRSSETTYPFNCIDYGPGVLFNTYDGDIMEIKANLVNNNIKIQNFGRHIARLDPIRIEMVNKIGEYNYHHCDTKAMRLKSNYIFIVGALKKHKFEHRTFELVPDKCEICKLIKDNKEGPGYLTVLRKIRNRVETIFHHIFENNEPEGLQVGDFDRDGRIEIVVHIHWGDYIVFERNIRSRDWEITYKNKNIEKVKDYFDNKMENYTLSMDQYGNLMEPLATEGDYIPIGDIISDNISEGEHLMQYKLKKDENNNLFIAYLLKSDMKKTLNYSQIIPEDDTYILQNLASAKINENDYINIIKMADIDNDSKDEIILAGNSGIVFYKIAADSEVYEARLKIYLDAIEAAKKYENIFLLSKNTEVASMIYLELLDDPDAAAKLYIDLAEKYLDLSRYNDARKAYAKAGDIYKNIDNEDLALKYYLLALDQFEKVIYEKIPDEKVRIQMRSQYSKLTDIVVDIYFSKLAENPKDEETILDLIAEVEFSKCREITEYLEKNELTSSCPEAKQLDKKLDKLASELSTINDKIDNLMKKYDNKSISFDNYKSNKADLLKTKLELYNEINETRKTILEKCIDPGNVLLERKNRKEILNKFKKEFNRKDNWVALEFIKTGDKIGVVLIDSKMEIFGSINYDQEDIEKYLRLYANVIDNLHFEVTQRAIASSKGVDQNVETEEDPVILAENNLKTISEELYDLIFPNKIKGLLSKNKYEYLIIVPHRELHSIPFEILKDDQDDFLGLKYSLSKNFSLDLSRISISKETESKDLKAFLIGNPNQDQYIVFNGYKLPLGLEFAEKEVNEIKNKIVNSQFTEPDLLLSEDATKLNFQTNIEAKPFNLIHYAGHAQYTSGNAEKSFLLLRGKKEEYEEPDEDQILDANEIAELRFKGNPVVILSACESGISETIGGDEFFGLVRGLTLAGATDLILTSWPVFDDSAADFMQEFYDSFLMGNDIGRSMKSARKKVLENINKGKYGEDKFPLLRWGAFISFGKPFKSVKHK
ncbi:MAG: CHAT domain-containing protein, partial [Candidatus Lokiarchaeota archaeon]|nr:CHAT domain-containing protein [Candidatus Lokiarchaeota archaeon]